MRSITWYKKKLTKGRNSGLRVYDLLQRWRR